CRSSCLMHSRPRRSLPARWSNGLPPSSRNCLRMPSMPAPRRFGLNSVVVA
ncbi:MAG: DNA mismatch repair protein MutL, partial [uncultured Chloroflexia bacterium]